MNDPKASTALRQLTDLGHPPAASRWAWAVARPEAGGRLRLPAPARTALGYEQGGRLEVRGVCSRVALVVRPAGPGAHLVIDVAGRLPLPVWLRRGPDRALLVGADVAAAVLLIAPASVVDGIGDLLVGGGSR